jgi:anti-sigma factor RsiW
MNPRDMIGMFRRRGGSRCIEIGRQIQTYLDGGLDPTTATRVAAHLDACRRCGLTASDYRHLKTALADTAGAVPADAIERLHHLAADLAAGDHRA